MTLAQGLFGRDDRIGGAAVWRELVSMCASRWEGEAEPRSGGGAFLAVRTERMW